MPSFSIEVSAETNPLNEDSLVRVLHAASSTVPGQIQTGTKQLQQWEKTAGFYKHLQSCYINQNLPFESRYLAIIQLKNGIDKYWRKTALNAVPKEDKAVIRERQINSCLDEVDDRLALQNALVVAKIARFEYPHDWPDLLTSLTNQLRNSNQISPLHLARCLLILLRVVKELSTARLQRSRQNLQLAAPEIVFVLGTLWSDTTASWSSQISQAPSVGNDVRLSMHISLLTIKTLRRLLVMANEHPNRDKDIVAFWKLTQDRLGYLMQLTTSVDVKSLLDKNILQLAKLHHALASDNPAAFALLPESMNLVRAYWGLAETFGNTFGSRDVNADATLDDDEGDKQNEKLVLNGLKIIRACLKMVHHPAHSFKLKSAEDKAERDQARNIVDQNLLTSEFVQQIMETTVTKYFVFRASDLRDWHVEPEEWEQREEGFGEDYEFSVRSCSEKLFLDLAINYKEMLVQPLLQVFYTVANPKNEDVLLKDSLYTAIGLAAPVVFEQLDFDAFVRDVLATEVQIAKPGYHILRRRAAILLGQWVSVKLNERRLSFEIFQHLLDPADSLNDQVVRVTAGRHLNKMVDDWEFKPDDFLPYCEIILTRLMSLIQEVETTETKMALLNTLSLIVQRLDQHIMPFAERIVSLLSPLWSAADEEHLMKQSILGTLTRLVNAMKASSAPLHALSIPIITAAIELGSETEVFLLEDAMDLWGAILNQSEAPGSPEVLQLLPCLYPIYQLGSENLRKALEITESYIILAPESILSDANRVALLTSLGSLLGNLRPEANGLVCNLIEMIIKAAEKLRGEAAVTQTAGDLVQTGVMAKLLEGLQGSYIAHCTTGPRAMDSLVEGIVETDYLSIFSQLILGSLTGFCQAIEAAAAQINVNSNNNETSLSSTMTWLLKEWFSHFENIGDPSRRKLMCLALTKLLETNQDFILTDLQSLMTIWTDVVTELREGAEDAAGDSLVYSRDGMQPPEEPESPEDARRRLLTFSDVVHTVKVPEFIKHHLSMAIAASRGQFEQEWLVNVDKDVVSSFGGLGIM